MPDSTAVELAKTLRQLVNAPLPPDLDPEHPFWVACRNARATLAAYESVTGIDGEQDERSPEPNRWVVVAFDFGNTDKHDAVLATAETEQEAAEIGAELLQQIWDLTDGMSDLVIEHVFVGPWPRTAYTVTRQFVAETSEWQCCAGPNEAGEHYGGCPTRRKEAPDA